jgi:hypothetical protein
MKPKTKGSIVSIIIEDGAHHYDLRGAHPKDTKSVLDARRLEVLYFKKWIAKHVQTEKKTKKKNGWFGSHCLHIIMLSPLYPMLS